MNVIDPSVAEPSQSTAPAPLGLPSDEAAAVPPAPRGTPPTPRLDPATATRAVVPAPSIEDLQHWFG
jgi:hypothetical protein